MHNSCMLRYTPVMLIAGLFLPTGTGLYAQQDAPQPRLSRAETASQQNVPSDSPLRTELESFKRAMVALEAKIDHPAKDSWDKLGILTPLISAALAALIGAYITREYNKRQLDVSEIETVEKFFPHLASSDKQMKSGALAALSMLRNRRLAMTVAITFGGPEEVGRMRTMLRQDTRQIARSLVEADINETITSGKRVLWVDDQPENNESGIKALQSQGIEVITCKTTREAMEKVRECKFDIIITDQLRFEDGGRKDTAGYEFIRKLQKAAVNVPVVLSTAMPNREEARNKFGFYDTATTQRDVLELVMKAVQRP